MQIAAVQAASTYPCRVTFIVVEVVVKVEIIVYFFTPFKFVQVLHVVSRSEARHSRFHFAAIL